jgi:sugar phosphate isomerase/epimerase
VLSDKYFPASILMWSRTVSEFLEAVARRGFRGAEVWAQHLDRSGERAGPIDAHARSLGLRLTLHAVSYDVNPLSQNREIRDLSRRQVLDSLALGAELGADVVVIHPGQLSSSTDDPEDYWPDLLDFCAQLDEHAARLGTSVGVEGMERRLREFLVEPGALNRLAQEMKRNGWEHLGLTADLAHLATFTDPVTALASIQRLRHIHLSDGDPPDATHRPLGLGRLPVEAMLDAAEATGVQTITIEGRWRRDEEHALDRAARVLAARAKSG